MKTIKQVLLGWYACVMRTGARLRGCTVGKGVFISGSPYIVIRKGARIVLEEGVTVHSSRRMNPVLTTRSTLAANADGAEIVLRRHSGVSGCCIVCTSRIEIGENTLVGADSLILDNDAHRRDAQGGWLSTLRDGSEGRPISIGRNCFIGARCIILKGVTIGEGSVVAAGTTVHRDVPAHSLVYGSPMRVKPLESDAHL